MPETYTMKILQAMQDFHGRIIRRFPPRMSRQLIHGMLLAIREFAKFAELHNETHPLLTARHSLTHE